jgi:hypothetical protein
MVNISSGGHYISLRRIEMVKALLYWAHIDLKLDIKHTSFLRAVLTVE